MILMLGLLIGQLNAPDASRLIVAKPAVLAVVETDKLHGEPWKLCWSPDGRQLYLAAMKRKDGGMDLTHHLIDAASGAVETLDVEPPWASSYWEWKSWKSAPGRPEFVITIDQQKKNESATARPSGGAMARGSASGDPGISIDDAAGQMSSNVMVITLLLKGQVLGQWKGEPFVPGLTFGWAPQNMDAIAFADKDGHLILMDEQGRRQRIEPTKNAQLPAWSADGARVAWVEKQDRRKFRIQVANVSGS